MLYRTNTKETVSEELGTFYCPQQKDNSAKETHCCTSMAKLTTFIRLRFHVDEQQYEMKVIFARHCQQWLRERAPMLGFMFIVYLVITSRLDLKEFISVKSHGAIECTLSVVKAVTFVV